MRDGLEKKRELKSKNNISKKHEIVSDSLV